MPHRPLRQAGRRRRRSRRRRRWRRCCAKAHANGVTSVIEVDPAFVRAKEPQRARGRRAVVARHRHRRGRSAGQGARAPVPGPRRRAWSSARRWSAPMPHADGIELVTPHERFVARHRRQRRRPVCRRGVGAARRAGVHDLSRAAASTPSWRRRKRAHGQRPGVSAAARLGRRPRRPPGQDDVGQRDAGADHSLPGIEGRLRGRAAGARGVRRTGAAPAAVGDAGGPAAGRQRHSRQAARPRPEVRGLPDRARSGEPARDPGGGHRFAGTHVVPGRRRARGAESGRTSSPPKAGRRISGM